MLKAESLLQRLEDELYEQRLPYNAARKVFKGSSRIFQKVAALLSEYKPGDSAEKAVYVVAQAQLLLKNIFDAKKIVKAYESKETQAKKLRASLPVVKD